MRHKMRDQYKTQERAISLVITSLVFVSALVIAVIGSAPSEAHADSIATRVGTLGTATVNGSLVVTNDGKYAYTATPNNSIKKFDLETGALVATITAFNPGGLTLTPDGKTLLAGAASTGEVNHPSDRLLKISTETDTILATLSTDSWPNDGGASVNLRYPLVSPDGSRALINYATGGKELMASVDLSSNVMTPVELPAEFSTVSCCLFIMDSRGESLYVTWQQFGYKNFVSRMSLDTGTVTWTRQLPYNALPRDVVEGSDGYRYVLGTDAYRYYTYIFRYNMATGDRDTLFASEMDGSPDENLFLVDNGWGLRFYTKAWYMGEMGLQRKTSVHHLHFSNLQRSDVEVLDTEGEAFGFSINGDRSAFYNYEPDTSSGSLFVVELEDSTQTLTLPTIPQQILGIGTPTLSASASSGLTISFSSITPSTCTTDGVSVTGLDTGTCIIRATQGGGKGWKAASADITFSYRKPTITWAQPVDDVKRSQSRVVSATSDSGLPVAFTSQTPSVCLISGSTINYLAAGRCSVTASQAASGMIPAADDVVREFRIFPSSVGSEIGVSIDQGSVYTNEAKVTLSIAWPDFATGVKVSNDGGFAPSKTSIFDVNDEIEWLLDSSVKGSFTKIVYIKFMGSDVDSSRLYSDDIILDTTAPTLTSVVGSAEPPAASSVSVASLRAKPRISGVRITVRAKDTLSGIGLVQLKTSTRGRVTSIKTSNPKATSRSVRIKTAKSSVFVRVVDRAGNPSRWLKVPVK